MIDLLRFLSIALRAYRGARQGGRFGCGHFLIQKHTR